MKETELCEKFLGLFRGKKSPVLQGEVYPEVDVKQVPVDMVLTWRDERYRFYHAIEAKVRLTWELVSQAMRRRQWFDYVSIVVPRRFKKKVVFVQGGYDSVWNVTESLDDVLTRHGIGLYQIRGEYLDIIREPVLNVGADNSVINLYDGHKQNVAGSACVKKHTWLKQLVLEVDKISAQYPDGIKLSDVFQMLPVEFRKKAKPRNLAQWYRTKCELVSGLTSSIEKRDGRLYLVQVKF